ncbi:hypothetical protein BDR26DRAFT_915318 [Obelidium mucronatum]|nr:hypothetical protein BDR26DRAFT_915318 [Obelidium mucronatum]
MNSNSHHYRPPKRKATASLVSFKAETSSSENEDEDQIKPETGDSIQSAAAVKEKGKPGRKRINHVDPENKRIAQNRVAQRAYRERQLNHAKELEAKVVELSERLAAKEEGGTNYSDLMQELESLRTRNAELSIRLGMISESAAPQKIEAARSTECPECANLREKYARLETHVSLLQTQLQLLEKSGGDGVRIMGDEERYGRESLLGNGAGDPLQPQIQSALEFMTTSASSSSLIVSPMAVPPTWSPQIQMSTCSGSPIISESSQQNEKVPSSADLFGPPIVDTLRTQLKELKSLANTRFVDDYVDTFVDQTKCTDSKSAKQNLMKLVVVRRKLLDACHAVLDRRSCIEICESFKEINKQHLVGKKRKSEISHT